MATVGWGTTVHCDSPTERYFPASRLLSDSRYSYECGMLCPPIVHPPVNVLFSLPCFGDLRAIVIKPFVGRHRVTHLNIFLLSGMAHDRNSTGSAKKILHFMKAQRARKLSATVDYLQPFVTINLDNYPVRSVAAVRLNSSEMIPSDSCSHSAVCLYGIDIPFRKKQQRWDHVLIQLCKTDATCVPCLGAVELWCVDLFKKIAPAPATETNVINRIYTTRPTSSTSDDEGSAAAPEHYLDLLTGELMQDPIKLPSGNYTDRSSLTQFWQQRLACNPNAKLVDPFTMVPIDQTHLFCDVQFKSEIENYRNLREKLGRLCSKLECAAPDVSQIGALPLHESSSDEESIGDGTEILKRYPHLNVH